MTKMTISQALRKASSLKCKLKEVTNRATAHVSHLSNDTPAYSFEKCVKERESLVAELVDLEARISKANGSVTTTFDNKEVTLAYLIKLDQEMKSEISFYQNLYLRNDSDERVEYQYNDSGAAIPVKVKTQYVSEISIVDRDSKVESLQDKFNQLHDLIERLNHTNFIE